MIHRIDDKGLTQVVTSKMRLRLFRPVWGGPYAAPHPGRQRRAGPISHHPSVAAPSCVPSRGGGFQVRACG